jgi:hypothetical protein
MNESTIEFHAALKTLNRYYHSPGVNNADGIREIGI